MKYVIKNGAVSINGETILESINLEINEKSHIGIVGKNGAGKTTLLRSIVDNSMLESGIDDTPFQVIKQGNPSIGYLKQIELNDNNTMLEEVRKPFIDIIKMEDRLECLVNEMNSRDDIKLVEEYTALEEKFKNNGGYTYKKEYEVLIKKFGFKEEDKSKYLSEFSGGQKTKIAFIKMLLNKPDILLLDEPTNHLDIDTVEWLEEYLKNYKKAIVVVSHDRMFINNIVDTIYDISYGALIKYSGNYDYYEHQKQLNYEKALKDYEFQQKEIARLNELIEKFKHKPKKASMARSKKKVLERMQKVEKPDKEEAYIFKEKLEPLMPGAKNVLETEHLKIGYKNPIRELTLRIRRGQKIAVLGANGAGKTTFFKTIIGQLQPISGKYIIGNGIATGYFDQHSGEIQSEKRVEEHFGECFPKLTEKEKRQILGRYLFSSQKANVKISDLSGGEMY